MQSKLHSDDAEEVELGDVSLLNETKAGPRHSSAPAPVPDGGLLDTGSPWARLGRRLSRQNIVAAISTLTAFALLVALIAQHAPPQHAPDGGYYGTTAPEGIIEASFQSSHDWRGRPRMVTGSSGAVSADHGRCSDMGLAVLREGGNAVDAAVTTALCQGVFNPMASGAGGGGFITVLSPNGSAEIIDARETAPGAANETMYKGQPGLAVTGGLAIAVPLELRGLALAHARHGSLPWARLVTPVLPYARDGFPAHPYLVAALSSNVTLFKMVQEPALRDVFLVKDGGQWRAPKVNETCCRRPALADLLQKVADEGVDVMHNGNLAASLAAEIQAAGGVVTEADLASVQPQVKPAMRASVFGMELVFPPPPSSAAAIVTALRILAGYELRLPAAGTLGTHRIVEAMKHAFALRMNLGDPGPDAGAPYVNVTDVLEAMLDPAFAASLRADILDDRTQNVTEYGGRFNVLEYGPDDHGTSHFNVVDKFGGAVAMTTTVNTGFGSHVMSQSTGLLLNNEMDDFSTPGQPNVYNLPPAKANFIRPGKKPLSSMSPTVVLYQGRLRAVVGASGGPLIVSSVFQTLARILAECDNHFGAVADPRMHHQLLPNNVFVENWSAHGVDFRFPALDMQGLEKRGHNVTAFPWGAVVQLILVDPDTGNFTAISDPRKDGAPAAY